MLASFICMVLCVIICGWSLFASWVIFACSAGLSGRVDWFPVVLGLLVAGASAYGAYYFAPFSISFNEG